MNYHDINKLFSINSFIFSMKKLFPTKVKNKCLVNFIGLYHLIGASMILCGILAKPKYLYIHIFLTSFMLFTYYIFNNKCFVTLITNFLCENDTSPLIIPISKVKHIIYLLLSLSIIFYLFPSFSLYNILFT